MYYRRNEDNGFLFIEFWDGKVIEILKGELSIKI
ncbi:hypothetical protein BCE_5464 [Bacillus cereus ATCC 10987]|uniref:Uncharacterized protein n=1 Tax=Bacillus cereus (strain ATCC 10987 / NRS 248) TaxID=222523 RepID=Q72XB4_BACC1|nr:hypothetical protein BCE_5464 [Bacillus cereus ATCC 10987]